MQPFYFSTNSKVIMWAMLDYKVFAIIVISIKQEKYYTAINGRKRKKKVEITVLYRLHI